MTAAVDVQREEYDGNHDADDRQNQAMLTAVPLFGKAEHCGSESDYGNVTATEHGDLLFTGQV
jgi:hypothetical protein